MFESDHKSKDAPNIEKDKVPPPQPPTETVQQPSSAALAQQASSAHLHVSLARPFALTSLQILPFIDCLTKSVVGFFQYVIFFCSTNNLIKLTLMKKYCRC